MNCSAITLGLLPDVTTGLRAGYYVALNEVTSTLAKRAALRAEVEAWWHSNGWGLPPLSAGVPNLALVSRNIGTARYEDIAFAQLAHAGGLVPGWSTLHRDKMCNRSAVKRSYIAGTWVTGRGKAGGLKTVPHEYFVQVNPRDLKGRHENDHPHHVWHGRQLTEIIHDGESLIDRLEAHQTDVLGNGQPGQPFVRFDISNWYSGAGFQNARDYYIGLMSLFVGHAVLFEDFHGGESGEILDAFTSEVFQPAMHQLREIFGVMPLVTPLPWWRELAYFPAPGTDWRQHGIIPESLL